MMEPKPKAHDSGTAITSALREIKLLLSQDGNVVDGNGSGSGK